MYTVLLVDDEAILREGMRKYIPWNEYGVNTVLEAADVAEALDAMDRHEIDLMFVDVRMPGESGLDLLQTVHKRRSGVHVVIISGYHEFEYAQLSVRYGAEDYLLKPIKTEDVTRILGWFRDQREQLRKEQREEKRWMNDLFAKSFHYALTGKDEFLTERNGAAEERLQTFEWLDKLVHRYTGCMFQFIAVAGSGYADVRELFPKSSGAVPGHAGTGTAERLAELEQVEAIVPAVLGDGIAAYLLVYRNAAAEDGLMELLGQICSLPEDAWAYSPVLSASGLPQYVTQAYVETIRTKLFYKTDRKPVPFDPGHIVTSAYEISEATLNAFRKAVSEESPEKIKFYLSELYFQLCANPLYSIASVKRAYKQLYELALEYGRRHYEASMPESGRAGDEWALETVDRSVTLLALHRTAERLFTELVRRWLNEGGRSSHRVVKEVKKYVLSHLSEPILLVDLAEKYQMSSEYLSFLFKKQEGVNFNHYLKQTRIDKAKELLRASSTLKVYEVAFAVGYQDAKHFTKVFKELTGITPAQFIERL